jgi:hypothetical protein
MGLHELREAGACGLIVAQRTIDKADESKREARLSCTDATACLVVGGPHQARPQFCGRIQK